VKVFLTCLSGHGLKLIRFGPEVQPEHFSIDVGVEGAVNGVVVSEPRLGLFTTDIERLTAESVYKGVLGIRRTWASGDIARFASGLINKNIPGSTSLAHT
jgi:hypothetical protein